jgi:thiamine pyrophosphokinase
MLSHPLESGQVFTALVLNYYLPPFLRTLWEKAKTRVCADGGANRLTTLFGETPFKRPDFIVGDFDSIRPAVRTRFEKLGSKLEYIYDQDFNDIQKCLKVLSKNSITEPVLVFGAIGGRLDQTIASFSAALSHSAHRLFFLDANNFCTWILPGDKGIHVPQKWTTKMCGLLPIARPLRHVRTTGLKWNCDFGLDMATFISSSNEIAEGHTQVLVETTDPVLWTNQTRKLDQLPL